MRYFQGKKKERENHFFLIFFIKYFPRKKRNNKRKIRLRSHMRKGYDPDWKKYGNPASGSLWFWIPMIQLEMAEATSKNEAFRSSPSWVKQNNTCLVSYNVLSLFLFFFPLIFFDCFFRVLSFFIILYWAVKCTFRFTFVIVC